MDTNSTRNKNSRYVSGGAAEVNRTAIEWWERTIFAPNIDDRSYVVEARFEGRLDLIAATFLDEPRYWWVIAMHNNILDPYNEIRVGVELRIPTLERVKSIMNGKLGGFTSTREVPISILPIV
jgi:hypothetical protein